VFVDGSGLIMTMIDKSEWLGETGARASTVVNYPARDCLPSIRSS